MFVTQHARHHSDARKQLICQCGVRRGADGERGADICLSLSLLPGPVSAQQMLFEYLRPQKWCLLSALIPLSWPGLTPPSIMPTLPLLVINDHWISWHSLTLGSIILYIFIFDCNSASSCVLPSSCQESPGPASLCQNIIKPREPGREELEPGEGRQGGGCRGHWLLPTLATHCRGLAKSIATLAPPWSKHLNVGKLCAVNGLHC